MNKTLRRRQVDLAQANFSAAISPALQRILLARGVTDDAALDYSLQRLIAPTGLLGIAEATACLQQALTKQQRILIIGDFDADGATSTALAVSALREFGAKQVEYLVPNRFTYGYGLTPEIVAVAVKWRPDIIITVDNGIASCEGVAAANAHGIQVIITDHHLPGRELPQAAAIVNPNQAGDLFASKCLAGVGVIFYLLSALRTVLREQGWFAAQGITEPSMAKYLDLVALGTVADVVPLDQLNRILVHQGLLRIRRGLACPGVVALLAIAKRQPARVVASDLGFALGPRLNAAGRLDDMSLGIECLLAAPDKAMLLAKELDTLNQERRQIEAQIKHEALDCVAKIQRDLHKQLPAGICLYDSAWHQGVIGIVAGRLKEEFHRPVIVFADGGEDQLKGSARSIAGIHMRDILDLIATCYPGLITKFGGHAMAAGLSLAKAKFADFKQAFVQVLQQTVAPEVLQAEVLSDGELAAECFSLDFAEQLMALGPWGQAFPEPVFDGEFMLLDQRIVGSSHLKLTLAVPASGQQLDAIAFNIDTQQWPNHRCQRVHLVYHLESNEFNGLNRLQLRVERLQAL